VQEVGSNVNITCNITSTFGLSEVKAIVTDPGSITTNNTMSNIGGTDTYYYNTIYTTAGEYDYYIYAKDTNNDITTSSIYSFEIGIPPDITLETASPIVQQNGNNVNLTCDVFDNILVNSVSINITDPLGGYSVHSMNEAASRAGSYYYNASYSVDGLYRFIVTADDNNGNVALSVMHFFYIGDGGISNALSLESGWNLISTPVEYGFMASEIAESLEGCLTVNKWDSVNQTYKPFIVGGPPDFDFAVSPGVGLFVELDSACEVVFCGVPALNPSVGLQIPWNMIGWYNQSSTNAISLAENITGCLTVNSWDSVNQTYKPYIVGGPPDFDFPIYAGMGLFVEVDTVSTWNGEG
jgi:hypothetical protein